MRWLFVPLLALFAVSAEARFPRGTPLGNQIYYNIVTDGGATCDGVANAAPAFKTFNDWALANQGSNQVVLTVPSGSNCLFSTDAGGPLSPFGLQNSFTAGINNLVIEMTGATLTQGAATFTLGSVGICSAGLTQSNGCSARLQTVSAGSLTVALTGASYSAGYVSRFSVGQWVMVGGLNTQALWNTPSGSGDPPNLTYFDFRQVTATCNNTGPCTGGATITLDRPLSNSYLSTWPEYNSGDAFRPDAGGPATIYALGRLAPNYNTGNLWGSTLEVRGGTLSKSGQYYAGGRNTTLRNVTMVNGVGMVPTVNETFTAINTVWPSGQQIEVDKLIGSVTLDNISGLNQIAFQSNSTDLLVLKNSTIGDVTGGAKRSELTDVTLTTLNAGTRAYGNIPGPFICTRCDVGTFSSSGVFQDENPSPFSMSGGVISFPNTAAQGSGPSERWASVIGQTIFFATVDTITGACCSSIDAFSVLGVTQDPTNTYVQTSQGGGFPNYANLNGAYIQFRSSGPMQFTCDDCTGDPKLVAMNTQQGATPLTPACSYSNRPYAPSATGSTGGICGIGNLISFTVDVTTASTHTGAVSLQVGGQFNNQTTIKQSNWSQETFAPRINLKQTGTRVITPSGVTCNGSPGGCAGDTISAPTEAVWFYGGVNPYLCGSTCPGTMSGGVDPQYTITLQTDQTP